MPCNGRPRSGAFGLSALAGVVLAVAISASAWAASPPPIAAASAVGPGAGRLIQNPLVVARDQGASASLSGVFPGASNRSVWVFGDTLLSAGASGADCDHWATDTQAYSDGDLSTGIRVRLDFSDSTGAPTEFLPFTREEALYNAAHHTVDRAPCPQAHAASVCRAAVYGGCDAEYLLNAGPVIADPRRARLLFFFDVSWRVRLDEDTSGGKGVTIGAGVASWAAYQKPALRRLYFTSTASATRQTPYALGNGRPPSDDPHPHGAVDYTGPQYGEAPVIPPRQTQYLYLYDTTPPSPTPDCAFVYCYKTKLARVPLATLTNLSTWRFYDANCPAHVWQRSLFKASYLPSSDTTRVASAGPPNFSVTYNSYLHKYVMFYQEVLTRLIGYRTAPNPWGPWSAQGTVPFEEVAAGPGSFTYAAEAHDELSQQHGRIMYLTYVAGNTAGGVYALKVVFR